MAISLLNITACIITIIVIIAIATSSSAHSVTSNTAAEVQGRKKQGISGDFSTAKSILSENKKKGQLKFETDIILTDEQRKAFNLKSTAVEEAHTAGRKGYDANLQALYKSSSNLWKDGIVPYTISESISNAEMFLNAIKHWEKHTCIKFVPRTTEEHYVELINTAGCSSHVGCSYKGKQFISLTDLCMSKLGPAVHEIGHAIGFWHEQSRPDRNDYITINWNNIYSGYGYNFMKHTTDLIDSLNITYDYYSIMHYSLFSFSSNGEPTISIKQEIDDSKVGEGNELSELDIKQANLLYNCSKKTSSFAKSSFKTSNIHFISFALYNKAVNKCLKAQEMKHGYSISDPINSEYEIVLSAGCDKDTAQWNVDHNGRIVHTATKLCLSSTTSSERFVLRNCLVTPNWRMQWSCDGQLIVQPQTGLCLSVKSDKFSSNSLMNELKDMLILLPTNTDTLGLAVCNSSNEHHFFTTIGTEHTSGGSSDNETLCTLFPSYQASNCYTENKRNTANWMRCKRRGHFVVAFNFIKDKSFIKSLICCKAYPIIVTSSPDKMNSATKADYVLSADTCFHRPWWTSVGLSMFQCHRGEYLHGIRYAYYGHSARQVECCRIKGRDVFNYSRCEKVLKGSSCHRGVDRGEFITRYSNNCIGSSNTQECNKELQCCY